LNFVKFAAKNRPVDAENAIIRLSEIMRFALEQSNADLISVSSEIQQIKNVIELNCLRFDNKLNINYEEAIEDESLQIIPIVLLTLVENLFKHGNLLENEIPAIIKINADENRLVFHTSNLPNAVILKSTKTGIKNIVSRLKLYYGDDFQFTFGLQDGIYLTKLNIPLKTPKIQV
ncbi:MAG: hypothetical protein EOO07_24325, partial [Chitinophagaceae bacterium]